LRDIPILIGGAGERKTLPLVGRYADIWHSFLDVETFRRKNDLVSQHAVDAGRDPAAIERAQGWLPGTDGDALAAEGVTLFTTEIHPTDDGYDFTQLREMLAWRG
jgi:alkanesulfonate monooxygenase SsuD/methylene tetrahydromethanopterin reductase-like flavin-dependent oxidoreductase (luciferase family)